MAAKTTTKKKAAAPAPTLGAAVLIYMKSTSHSLALAEPQIISIEGIGFIEGRQVTGKVGHRLEGKRTLVACDNVASLIEFPSEEDLFSEPQAKLIRAPEDTDRSPLLTSHEQNGVPPRHRARPQGEQGHHNRHRRHRNNRTRGGSLGGNRQDATLQSEYDAQRGEGQGFRRPR